MEGGMERRMEGRIEGRVEGWESPFPIGAALWGSVGSYLGVYLEGFVYCQTMKDYVRPPRACIVHIYR